MRNVCVVMVCVLTMSCAATTQFTMPEYQGKPLGGGLMVVLPLNTGNLIIDNEDDVADDLGQGNAVASYMQFFNEGFPKSLQHYGLNQKVVSKPYTQKPVMEMTSLPMGSEESLSLELPAERTIFDFDSVKAAYVLIWGSMHVSRFAGSAGVWIPGPKGTSTFIGGESPALMHRFAYALWDNKAGKVIAYGKYTSKVSFLFAMTKITWEGALADMGRSIMEKSPFYNNAAY